MMENNSYKTMVTPKGTAMWACLDKPEEFNGTVVGYTITLVPSKEDADKLVRQLDGILEDAKQKDERFKGKKWAAEPMMGYKEDADGNIVFKFKQKVSYVDKKGKTHKLGVRIFDAVGNPMNPKATIIGNGSIIRVAFTPIPFNVNKNVNGVSLRLEAVQVLKLEEYKKYTTNMGSFGFSEVSDGFHSSKEQQQVFMNNDMVMNDDDDEIDAEMDGDF